MTLATLLAVLFCGVALSLAMGLLSLVGLAPQSSGSEWPFPAVDAWSLLADAAYLSLSCFLIAWVVRRAVRDWSADWDVRLGPVAFAAAIGSDAISAGSDGSNLAAFALVVVVGRQVALMPAPALRWNPGRPVSALLALAVVVLAAAAASYQPFHPLSSAFEGRPSDTSFAVGGLADRRFAEREHEFMLGNDGIAGMTVRSIRPIGDEPSAVAIVTHRTGVRSASSLGAFERPVGVEHIGRGTTFSGRMRLTAATCLDPIRGSRLVRVTALDVRYTALGLTRTQRLAIDPPARLRCRGA